MLSLRSELEKIIHSIEINYHPEKIILYGSLAAGRETEGSDIDILVVKDTDKDPWSRSTEVDRFIDHQAPVDVLVYTSREIEERLKMRDFFIKDILENGKVVYEK